jgi:hypothetical protein
LRLALAVSLAALPGFALFLFHASRYGTWLIDDAGISFAYARNLAAGLGFVAQAGQTPVEGFSNPLWTLLVALLTYIKIFSLPFIPKLVASLLVAGAFLAFSAAMLQILPRTEALIVAAGALILTAANPGFVIWCVSGLENPLLAFLAATLLLTSLQATQAEGQALRVLCVRGGVIAAGLALTRPDALVYSTVFPLACLLRFEPWTTRRLGKYALAYGISFAAPAGAYAIFRRLYFHEWLPNTYYAKPGVSLHALREAADLEGPGAALLAHLARGILPAFSVVVMLVPAAALVWAARSWNEPTARKALLLCFFLLLAFFSYMVLPQDWMGEYRFATIAFPTTYLLGLLLLHQLISRSPLASMKQTLLASAALGILAASAPQFMFRSQYFASRPRVPLDRVASTAEMYNELADALKLTHGRILLPDLGGTLLLSRLDVVDVAGLCDREFGRLYFRDRPPEEFAQHILRNIKPDLVHIHLYWAARSGLPQSEEFATTYLDLGDGDYVRRESLPHDLNDDQARAIRTQLVQTDRTAHTLAHLNRAMGLGR